MPTRHLCTLEAPCIEIDDPKVLARDVHLLSSFGEVAVHVLDGELEHGSSWVFEYWARMEYTAHKIAGLAAQGQPVHSVGGIVIDALGEFERCWMLKSEHSVSGDSYQIHPAFIQSV